MKPEATVEEFLTAIRAAMDKPLEPFRISSIEEHLDTMGAPLTAQSSAIAGLSALA